MRHIPRHVLQTCTDQVQTILEATGWVTDPVNFGQPAATVESGQPPLYGQVALPAGNAVHVSLGDEPPTDEEELGGHLESVNFPLFVDIFGTSHTIATAIAADIKEALRNRLLIIFDYAEQADSDHLIEFQHVAVETPQVSVNVDARRWRVVKAIAHTILND